MNQNSNKMKAEEYKSQFREIGHIDGAPMFVRKDEYPGILDEDDIARILKEGKYLSEYELMDNFAELEKGVLVSKIYFELYEVIDMGGNIQGNLSTYAHNLLQNHKQDESEWIFEKEVPIPDLISSGTKGYYKHKTVIELLDDFAKRKAIEFKEYYMEMAHCFSENPEINTEEELTEYCYDKFKQDETTLGN